MNINVVKFKITGISPLLCHNPSGMTGGPPKMGVKKIPTPAEEAKAGLYVHGDELVLPAIAFRSCIIYACSGKKVGKATARSIVAPSIENEHEWCVLKDAQGKKAAEWEVDARRVTNPSTGGSVIRGRAKFMKWSTLLAIKVDFDMVPDTQVLLDLLNEAGLKCGVGDYRPECTGWFGKFSAELI